ncbi:MAG: N-acetyltransferase [Bacteroidia bacterium]|nr:N-acetyltransferase [Bacteroidia bacterium]
MPFRSLNDDFSFSLYERASSVPANDWDTISKNDTIFLERDYLAIVETGQHTKLTSRYVIVYYKGKPCGIIYFQIVDFKAGVFGELLDTQVQDIKSKRLNLFEKYIDSNKDEVLLRLFTCGNNLVSGEYGYLFDKKLSEDQAHTVLLKIVEIVSKEEKLARTISAILLKDFHKPLQPAELFEDEKYSNFFVEPNLVVDIPSEVNSVSEYIALFSKKYRNRAKSIFKSIEGVEIKYLTIDEIKTHEKQLYKLYEGIFEKAKFKLIKLPEDYFSSVKTIYEKEFTVKAFLKDGKLIAFASSFLMPDNSLEAHYIGFDYELNNQYNLYQNILYAMIDEAIKNKRAKVNLGRTAAEIKTTVGAKAENLICYIKPQNTISKLIQKPFISFLQPAEWIPRNPFKEEEK